MRLLLYIFGEEGFLKALFIHICNPQEDPEKIFAIYRIAAASREKHICCLFKRALASFGVIRLLLKLYDESFVTLDSHIIRIISVYSST